MTLPPTSLTAEALIDAYEEAARKNPETAIGMIMWLMVYDEKKVSWARDFLADFGVFGNDPDAGKEAQKRKIHRWRKKCEEVAGLPPREKKGNIATYQQRLNDWRRINPRPSKEQLLAGWAPTPLPTKNTEETIPGITNTTEAPALERIAPRPSPLEEHKENDAVEGEVEKANPTQRKNPTYEVPEFSPDDYKPRKEAPLVIPVN